MYVYLLRHILPSIYEVRVYISKECTYISSGISMQLYYRHIIPVLFPYFFTHPLLVAISFRASLHPTPHPSIHPSNPSPLEVLGFLLPRQGDRQRWGLVNGSSFCRLEIELSDHTAATTLIPPTPDPALRWPRGRGVTGGRARGTRRREIKDV